jgi:hypothetical protein
MSKELVSSSRTFFAAIAFFEFFATVFFLFAAVGKHAQRTVVLEE